MLLKIIFALHVMIFVQNAQEKQKFAQVVNLHKTSGEIASHVNNLTKRM